MEVFVQCLLDFSIIFLLVLFVYKVFINRKRKDYEKLKKSSEVRTVIKRYNLNMKKIKYNSLLNAISCINSFIIAFTAVIVINIESLLWSIVFGLLAIIILTYSSYEILGRYYIRKGYSDTE